MSVSRIVSEIFGVK